MLLFALPQVDMPQVLTELVGKFFSVVPNILGALLVFFIGWLIGRLGARLLRKLLKVTGVDKLAERLNDIDLIAKSKMKIVPSELLAKIFYYFVLLIFTMLATEILQMPAVSNLITDLLNYLPNLLVAGLVLIVGVLFADFIKSMVLTAARSLGIPSANVIANFIFYFLLIAVAMSALGQAQIDTEFLRNNLTVIVAGVILAFAFGYGFASRDMMANFIASFYSKSKVNIGDVIRIGEVRGEVIALDNTSVTIQEDDRRVIIPLSKLTSENVEIFEQS